MAMVTIIICTIHGYGILLLQYMAMVIIIIGTIHGYDILLLCRYNTSLWLLSLLV